MNTFGQTPTSVETVQNLSIVQMDGRGAQEPAKEKSPEHMNNICKYLQRMKAIVPYGTVAQMSSNFMPLLMNCTRSTRSYAMVIL
jgi:hypothetical protein